MFFGRTDAEAETPLLWPPHAKSWLTGKDPDAGRDWGQEEKGMTEDEMAGWHHRLDAHEFGWTQGVGDRQGSLACCDSWGHKESDTTEWLNWTELIVHTTEFQNYSTHSITNHKVTNRFQHIVKETSRIYVKSSRFVKCLTVHNQYVMLIGCDRGKNPWFWSGDIV